MIFKNIREKKGKASVNKALKSNNRKITSTNYTLAKTIGIVYEIKDKDYQFFVNEFVDFLREEIGFKTISTLGFYNAKEIPSFLNSGNKFQFYNNTHLNWFFLPKINEVKEFQTKEFDILIDLSSEYILPIKYIVAASQAKFKIGRYSKENKKFYDFMINLDEKAIIRDFTNQINHYLKQ